MNNRIIVDISNFIFVFNKPQKVDAIFLPGGSHPEQPEYAAKLYNKGFAKYVIPSGGVSVKRDKWSGVRSKAEIYSGDYKTDCEFFTDVLIKNGVPGTAIFGEEKSSADKCIDGNDKAFRVCFYDSYQGAAAAQYIKDNDIVDTVGVLYQSDVDYSVGLYNAFVEKCGELGITIAETQTFTSTTSTDFSTQVNALVASGAKLVFIPIYAEEASTFLTQARGKFAGDVYFFGADGLDGILGKVEQDPTIANNVLMLTPFSADNPAENVQSFVKKYQEAYGATPDQFAADAYDAIYVIKAAVEKAGSTSGAALASALTSLTVEGVTGIMTWTADGNTNKPASAILYYDGVGTLFDSQD